MAVATVDAVPVRAGETVAVPVAWISAGGFAVASVWFALIESGITQRAAPDFPGASLDAALRAHYSWFTTTLLQERMVTGIAIAAFATMIVAVWTLRRRLGAVASATAGALTVSLGAATWITGNLLQLGGHRAVGAMANNGNPLEIANAINFTVDMVDHAFELAGLSMVALGLACLAVAGWRTTRASRSWCVYTAGVATMLLALVITRATDNGAAADILLVVVGAVLTPAWLIWSERVGRATAEVPAGTGTLRPASLPE